MLASYCLSCPGVWLWRCLTEGECLFKRLGRCTVPSPAALSSFSPNPGLKLKAAQGWGSWGRKLAWISALRGSPNLHLSIPAPWPPLLGCMVVNPVDAMDEGGWVEERGGGGVLGTQLWECGPRCSQEILPQDRSTTLCSHDFCLMLVLLFFKICISFIIFCLCSLWNQCVKFVKGKSVLKS